MLTSDHKGEYPFERPSWEGMVVYINAILKLYGIIPQRNLYFDKIHLSPKSRSQDHIWVIHVKTRGWIKLDRIKNLMKENKSDVAVVHISSIFKSTQYQR
jgi:hypothetical protein